MPQAATILVVDDDEEMRAALSEALKRSGYGVDTAPDGEAGLRKIETGTYSLVVSDIRMPRKDGFELLKEVKRSSPQTPVILITAYGNIETAVEAMRKGADDYLLKPFSAETLEQSIKNLLGKKEKPAAKPAILKSPASAKNRVKKERKIITQDGRMLEIFDIIERTAPSKASVLIQGESGTGKELFARFIHLKSDRADRPFVAVNCAALPESLLESELFGHEKGAFTGAIARKAGKFELTNGGTILLDEITEMQIDLQAKLLRVLQEMEIDRVGGTSPVPIDVRVIATTNRLVEETIKEKKLREDLYFRLNVIPITIPPLRERPEDVPLLTDHFIRKFSEESGKEAKKLSPEAMDILKKCKWKGNVRELENVIERALLLCRNDTIFPKDLFLSPLSEKEEEKEGGKPFELTGTLEEMERRMILGTLERVGDNRTKAAEILGVSIRTLRNKLNAYRQAKSNGKNKIP